MKKFDYDLIVIGGGAAGLTCSTGAGQLGAKVLLVEKEPALGGDCLHFGCVPSKSLIKTSTVYQHMRQAQDYGLPKIELPPVDFRDVRQRIQAIIAHIQEHDSKEWIKQHYNVDTVFGRATFVDEHMISVQDRRITARNFVIATGSSPLIRDIPGLDEVSYLTNETVFDLERLPESMIVLGGGPIGLEMAQAFTRLGSRVTVVEFGPQILGKEDPDVSAFMRKKLEREGMNILTCHQAVHIERTESGEVGIMVKSRETNMEQLIEAESLFLAMGRKANAEGLGLDAVGVEYFNGRINVDAHLRTNTKNIYACGDVNGGFQFTHVAGYEAGIALVNAVLHLPIKVDYRHVPWATYLDPEVASVGYNETRAKEARLSYKVEVEYFRNNDRALAESEYDGYIKLLIGKKNIPIGVQIVGPHAGDLLAEWIVVMNSQIPISKVAQMIHPYPTFSELNKAVAGNYLAPSFFNNPVVKWLGSL